MDSGRVASASGVLVPERFCWLGEEPVLSGDDFNGRRPRSCLPMTPNIDGEAGLLSFSLGGAIQLPSKVVNPFPQGGFGQVR